MTTARNDEQYHKYALLLCIVLLLSSVMTLIMPVAHTYARADDAEHPAQTLPIEELPVPTMPVFPRKVIPGSGNKIWFIGEQTDQIGHVTTQGTTAIDAETAIDHLTDAAWTGKYLWFIDSGVLSYYNPATHVEKFFFLRVSNPGVVQPNPLANAVVAGAHGSLWVLSDSYLYLITSQLQETYFILPPLVRHGAIKGLTSDHNGNLWFTLPAIASVGFVTPAGHFTVYPLPAYVHSPQEPVAAWAPITALPDGNIAFLLLPSPDVWKVSPRGQFTRYPVPAGFAIKDWNSMTADASDTLWFTDIVNNRLVHMKCRGLFTSYPIPTENGQPASVILGPDHNIWFAETNSRYIGRINLHASPAQMRRSRMSRPTEPLDEFATPFIGISSDHIVSGPGGALWFNSTHGSTIARTTVHLTSISTYLLPVGQRADSLAVGSDNNLWFVSAPNIIGRLTADGELTEYHTTGPDTPRQITRGPDDTLWFLIGNGWGTITVNGQIHQHLFPAGTGAAGGSILHMVAGPDGNMWATENPNIGVIARITPQGQVSEFLFPPYDPDSVAPAPNYITVGPDGNLWFTELNSSSIGYITPQGVMHQVPAGNGTSFSGTIFNTYGIVTDRRGNIWYAGDNGTSEDFFRVAPDGTTTVFPFAEAAASTNQMTIGPIGNLWFVKTYDNTVGHAFITLL